MPNDPSEPQDSKTPPASERNAQRDEAKIVSRHPPPRLADLVDDLLWPRLLRATPLALRASRLGLAFFLLIALQAIGSLTLLWSEPGMPSFFDAVVYGKINAYAQIGDHPAAGLNALIVEFPRAILASYPWSSIPLTIIMIVVGVRFVGAVTRSAACEFALGRAISWRDAMTFSLRKWMSLIGVVTLPAIVVGLASLAMAVAGWALFSLPGLSLIGSLLYVLFLLGSLVAVLVLGAWLLGGLLLIPAIACEGVDSLDGVERAFALVFGQPLRLVAYLLILVVVGVLSVGVAALLGWGTIAFAEASATAWTGTTHSLGVFDADTVEEPGVLLTLPRFLLNLWESVVWLLVGAFALSYVYCASTILYLLLRQADTGQEHTEIWQPGMIEGVMAEAIEARAALNEGEA